MSNTAEDLYQDIMTYIKDAREITARGEFVSLDKLDKRVAQLCEAAQQLPVTESAAFADRLEEMVQELNALQQHFGDKRAEIADDINSISRHKQAAMAYKQQEKTAATGAPVSADESE